MRKRTWPLHGPTASSLGRKFVIKNHYSSAQSQALGCASTMNHSFPAKTGQVRLSSKLLVTADALSRAPQPETGDGMLQEEVESFVEGVTQTSLPATPAQLEEYRMAQEEDAGSSVLHKSMATEVLPCYKHRNSLIDVSSISLKLSR